ncbi:hypothetical protein GQ44DRAFT_187871 [Phaeosphaeriaceae sp. PMI808]|nr:hypothetical protein GQ44DRAFT_187871 [Phaeosphaeriaceae sp. PMI808]
MRKRDRLRNRVRPFFTSDATSSASPPGPPPYAQPTSSPPSPSATSRTLVLEKALAIHLRNIPEAEKAAFEQTSKPADERALLSGVRAYDAAHKDTSSFRPHAERLSKVLRLLDRFMGGVAIGIQASPEVSPLVVGAVRIVIDLALQFTIFFSKLTEMIYKFEDYLGPLAEYAKAADIELVEKSVVNAYVNLLNFGRKARTVFVDANGNHRRWTSFKTFLRQHWEPFESEFMSIEKDMQHNLDVLLRSVQARHFNDSRKTELARQHAERLAELARQREEKSAFLSWVSTIEFEKAHQEIYAKKHEQTCGWLIEEPKYQEWFNSSISSLLWCHGKPGIGKSVLASNVLEHITAQKELQKDTVICFAYYNYRHTQLGDVSGIIAALIKQLCRRRDSIPRSLLQIKDDALSPSLVGTQERFVSLIEDLSEVFIVFDALDECPKRERKDILSFVTGVVTALVPCRVKVFATSRREMDIAKAFQDKNIPTIQIQAENVVTDIQTFARSQVEKLRTGEHGKALYVTSDDLTERIIQTLISKADGM